MLAIRREPGIEERLDETREKPNLQVVSSALGEVITLFESTDHFTWTHHKTSKAYREIIRENLPENLSKQDIYDFSNMVQLLDAPENIARYVFISSMLQKAYDNGLNDFSLHFEDNYAYYVAAHCTGTKDHPLTYSVTGDVNDHAAFCSTHVNATYQDVSIFFARQSKDSEFTVKGTTSSYFGYAAEGNVFKFLKREEYEKQLKEDVAQENELIYIGKC